jgi:hypothetical protein
MATTELESIRRRLTARSPLVAPGVYGRLRRLAGLLVASPYRADLVAILWLLGCAAVVNWQSLVGQGIYGRSDTLTFFFPVFATLHESLRVGELPLWSPRIYGGFPLFAEGQIGALYPPALVAVLLPTPEDGFMALRVFHMCVALVGTYAYARTLSISPVGGVIAAFAFGLGSFVVAQQHHASLIAAAVWLPWVLACVELALRRHDWATDALLALAGILFAMAALASHIQPVMLTGALLVAYVLARQGAVMRRPGADLVTWRDRLRALAGPGSVGLWALVVVPSLALALAAVQLLPLYELSQQSWRAGAWSYRDAIEYSFPPPNFVTLLFPFFFRTPDGGSWSLWQAWETVLYVGVAPLALALLAVARVRHWTVAFFATVAVLGAFLSLGGYAPFGIFEALWALPGIQLQRAPARLAFLTTFALAMLAAHGIDWLASKIDITPSVRRSRTLLALFVGTLAALVIVILHLVVWRAWLHAAPQWARGVIAERYLVLSRDPLQPLTSVGVAEAFDRALDLASAKTVLPLVLMAVLALVFFLWRELPRRRSAWLAALVGLVTLDLVVFASDFHPVVARADLGRLSPAAQFLVDHSGPWRSLTEPNVEATRPNVLLPTGAQEAAGYSPLQLARHRWYESAVGSVGNTLLDLWNVRYLVTSTEPESLPSYQNVGYHPTRPLMIGGAATPNGTVELLVPAEPVTELRVIAALVDGATIRDGDVVGEWSLVDDQGVRRVLPVRAGRELADWSVADPSSRTAHRPVQAAGTIPIRDLNQQVDRPRTLSYAAIAIPDRVVVSGASYRHVHSSGKTILYGLALFDHQTDRLSQFHRPDKLAVAYRDRDVVIYENRDAFPRAWVAGQAVVVGPGESLARLAEGPFDPRRQVVLEGWPGDRVGVPGAPDDWARVASDPDGSVHVRARAANGGFLVLADPYYPGWRAFVDGVEVDIVRANYLFRAVPLPPGEHEVGFVYDPSSLRVGAVITLLGALAALVLVAMSLRGRSLARAGHEGEITD